MIEDILRSKIGFSTESVGQRKIDADILCRMRHCGIADRDQYLALLRKSPEELDRLIETVTVPETWFFRMKGAFEYLEEFTRGEWLTRLHPDGPLRVLSVPCSTGEEPYSIAMTFLECGLPPGTFVIDAMDINGVCLDKAREGVYTRNSFRGEKTELIHKYFTPSGQLFELSPKVCGTVNFFRQNLLEYQVPAPELRYDIIFCRNMLIYFDAEHQQRSVSILSAALKDHGLLFIGHSESGILFNSEFAHVGKNGCFTFRKTPPGATPPPRVRTVPAAARTAAPAPRPARKTAAAPTVPAGRNAPEPKPKVRPEPIRPESSPEEVRNHLLVEAEHQADLGNLSAAEELCRSYLLVNQLDPRAHFLMGMILLSDKKYLQAEKFFHKAIYLNPDHPEALLSMAAVKEHSGDRRSASNYRERARRINKAGKS